MVVVVAVVDSDDFDLLFFVVLVVAAGVSVTNAFFFAKYLLLLFTSENCGGEKHEILLKKLNISNSCSEKMIAVSNVSSMRSVALFSFVGAKTSGMSSIPAHRADASYDVRVCEFFQRN